VGIREKSGKHGNLSEAHCVHDQKWIRSQRPMTFDWKTLTDGYTLFAGEYHADTHLTAARQWNWYVWKGTERIGSDKGLDNSSASRAAAEKCIKEHMEKK